DSLVRVRQRDVLAERVKGVPTTPCVEHVPLVDALVCRIDACRNATRVHGALQVREAGDGLVRVEVAARGNPDDPWVAAKVDVHLATTRLEPHEADQVAAILADLVDVRVRTADVRVERE